MRYTLVNDAGPGWQVLLDLFILDNGKVDDLTRPPYEWNAER